MEVQKCGNQVGIGKDISRKIGNAVDPQSARHFVQSGYGQVKTAVLPVLASRHPSGMRLDRVEYQERGRSGLMDLASAAELRSTGFRHRDDERLMAVRRIIMVGKIGAKA